MRRIRIYYNGDLNTGITVMLDKNASHHLLRVLRKKIGDTFFIFNGKGGEFDAILKADQQKVACVEIGHFHALKTESSLSIHLGQGISRGERMDYAIQKASELGVAEITPLMTEYCQVQLSSERVLHWQAIATSAAEQSGRASVPIVHPASTFVTWISKKSNAKFICCPLRTSSVPRMKSNEFLDSLHTISDCLLTIGPEGGFSQEEIKAAMKANFIPLSLGPRILRTETASVVAMTMLQGRFGDLNPVFTF